MAEWQSDATMASDRSSGAGDVRFRLQADLERAASPRLATMASGFKGDLERAASAASDVASSVASSVVGSVASSMFNCGADAAGIGAGFFNFNGRDHAQAQGLQPMDSGGDGDDGIVQSNTTEQEERRPMERKTVNRKKSLIAIACADGTTKSPVQAGIALDEAKPMERGDLERAAPIAAAPPSSSNPRTIARDDLCFKRAQEAPDLVDDPPKTPNADDLLVRSDAGGSVGSSQQQPSAPKEDDEIIGRSTKRILSGGLILLLAAAVAVGVALAGGQTHDENTSERSANDGARAQSADTFATRTFPTPSENNNPSLSIEEGLFSDEEDLAITNAPPFLALPSDDLRDTSPSPKGAGPSGTNDAGKTTSSTTSSIAHETTPAPISSGPTTRRPSSSPLTYRPSQTPAVQQPTHTATIESPVASTALPPTTSHPSTQQPISSPPTRPPITSTPTGRPTTSPLPTRPPVTSTPTGKPATSQRPVRPLVTSAPSPRSTTRPSTGQPTGWPTSSFELDAVEEVAAPEHASSGDARQSLLTIELKTDNYGEETSWTLHAVHEENTVAAPIRSVEINTYQPNQQDSVQVYLAEGKYRFTLRDTFGDGFCCNNGSDGWYVLSLDGRELVRGGYYRHEVSYDIVVGYDPEMSDRDREWLDAHNVRRREWHERHGKSYVPLRWSEGLAADASSWADELLNDCDIHGIRHESGVNEGENLAKNTGSNDGYMGQLYPADNILTRWVDNEETWGWPENAHLTQALWRASRYVGCGDAARFYDDGAVCRVQVCRYVRAGNCAMRSYDAGEGDNWLVPMLLDDTRCGHPCPDEGCF